MSPPSGAITYLCVIKFKVFVDAFLVHFDKQFLADGATHIGYLHVGRFVRVNDRLHLKKNVLILSTIRIIWSYRKMAEWLCECQMVQHVMCKKN